MTLTDAAKHFTGIVLEIWPDENFQPGNERRRVRITHLFRRTAGYAGAVSQILLLSFLLEAVIIAMPIGFQLVLDNAIVAMDRNLLMLVAISLGLLLGFRVLTDYTRSWAILAAGARVTLQWKMSLFSHLMKLPLDYFERRHVGDIASRFTSIDTIQKTFTTGPVSGLVDGVMGPLLIVMMFLYSPRLALICLVTTALYAIARAEAYRLYRLANEEAIVFAAQENSHFIETLARDAEHQVARDRTSTPGSVGELPRGPGERRRAGCSDRSHVHHAEHCAVRDRSHPGHHHRRQCRHVEQPDRRHAGGVSRLQRPVLAADRPISRYGRQACHAVGAR